MNLLRKVTAGLLSLAIVAMPFQANAVEAVHIESTVQVANVTAGDTQYADSVNAKVDEVVKVQVWYHNKENPDSGKIAQNLKVKLALPTDKPGKSQVVTSTVSADNSNTVVDTANVNLSLDQASLEYIPGSAKWRHNTGTNESQNWVTDNIDDSVVGAGKVLENEKPCFNFEATVTVLMRVKANSISIVKQVRKTGETTWNLANSAKAGETLDYQITIKNTGNTVLHGVIVGDNLPPRMTYVDGSTLIRRSGDSTATKLGDNITKGGVPVGDYAPGSEAKILFKAKLNSDQKPGCIDFVNVGIVRVPGVTNEIYNTAKTTVCTDTPVTPPVTPPVTTLPQTGVETPLAGVAGMSGMSYAGYAYLKSKKGLKQALRNVRK